jgi:hypothetical protein
MVIEPPPAIYDYVPLVQPPVSYITEAQINHVCGKARPFGMKLYACTVFSRGCVSVFILNELDADDRKAALRHEFGHVNGWKH